MNEYKRQYQQLSDYALELFSEWAITSLANQILDGNGMPEIFGTGLGFSPMGDAPFGPVKIPIAVARLSPSGKTLSVILGACDFVDGMAKNPMVDVKNALHFTMKYCFIHEDCLTDSELSLACMEYQS